MTLHHRALVALVTCMLGAWTEIIPARNRARNSVSFTVSSFCCFLISDSTGLPVEMDGFLVE